ncbi:MAG: ATP-binding protein [Pseudomonadota bacterium]|nr:ATP-binding protein [Pseudomonadota bacterium]
MNNKAPTKSRRIWFYSLRARLILAVIIITLFAMTLAAYFTARTIKQEINANTIHEIGATLSTCNLFLENKLAALNATTQSIARDNTCRTTLRLNVVPQLQEHISDLRRNHQLSFLAVTDPDGKLLAFSPAAEKNGLQVSLANHPITNRALTGQSPTAFHLEETDFLKSRLQAQLKTNDFKPLLLFESAAPIKIRDRQIGSVLSGVLINENMALIQKMQEAAKSEKLVLVVGQQILLHCCLGKTEAQPFQGLIDYHLDSSLAPKLQPIFCPISKNNNYFGYHFIENSQNQRFAAIVTLVNANKKIDLLNTAMTHMGVIFGGALLLAIFLAFIVSNSIAKPIEQLSNAMKKLATGHLETRVSDPRDDEIGALSRGFNLMATKINRQVKTLTNEISRRHETEKELAAEKEHLNVTLASIADGVIAVNKQKQILFMNPAAEKISGWRADQVKGQTLADIFTLVDKNGNPEDKPLKEYHKESYDSELPNNKQTMVIDDARLQTHKGDIRLISHSSAPILSGKTVQGTVVVFRDTTEKRALQNEISKGQKLESLGILAGGLAHDFNNLLTAIMGNISLAMLTGDPEAKTLKFLQSAESASLRARDITQQLLTFAKGGAPVKELTSIEEIIRESATFSLRGSNCKCRFLFSPELQNTEIDKGQFSQVINNLTINATHAMPEGGTITISGENITLTDNQPATLSQGDYLKITIQDQGSGIPEDIKEKIFDPFFTTKEQGSGLGLASSYTIIKNHGGHIQVSETSPRGTSFTIYLAASKRNPILKQDSTISTFKGSGRILLLDDEEMIRETASRVLEHLGYEVEQVNEGKAALTAYRHSLEQNHPFELLIFDLTIPGGMGGIETLKKILVLNPKARAIVSSGYSNDPVMANFADYGFIDHIAKPYTVGKLSEVLIRCKR